MNIKILIWIVVFLSVLIWSAIEPAESILGTQGYVWDTQSDMLWALCGAIAALLSLSKLHDRQIKALVPPQ